MRYWNVAVGPSVVLLALAGMASLMLPNYYDAGTLLSIQAPKISSKLIETPSKEDMRERLESVAQNILSRSQLETILNNFDLYPTIGGIGRAELATAKFRSHIGIQPVTTATGVELLQVFKLSFRHSDPLVAYEVIKALSNLFVEESLLGNKNEIEGTEEFLDSELRKARQTLESTEQQVQQFIRENFTRLPEHLDAAIARLGNLQAQLQTNAQVLSANSLRRANLQNELAELNRHIAPANNNPDGAASDTSLEELKETLATLESKYSPEHPDIILTKQQIEALQRQQFSRPKRSRGGRPATSSASALAVRHRINELDVQDSSLQKESTALKEQIAALQKDIEAMPIAEQQLIKIRRDYESIKDNYQKLLAAKSNAALQNSLVRSQKHAQFKIIDPPQPPIFAAGPPRLIISVAGVILSTSCFFAICLLRYFFNFSFKSKEELEKETGLAVIGVIPPMPTNQALSKRQKETILSVLMSALLFAGIAVLIRLTLVDFIG